MRIFEKRLLGVDFGKRRMGIAISDPMRIVARGMETISYYSLDQLWQKFAKIFASHNIERVIIGSPINLNGSESAISADVQEFANQLQEQLQVPVEFWDERFTSKTAQEILHQMGKSPSKNRGKIDKIAAVLILQGYLDRLSAVERGSEK